MLSSFYTLLYLPHLRQHDTDDTLRSSTVCPIVTIIIVHWPTISYEGMFQAVKHIMKPEVDIVVTDSGIVIYRQSFP